MCDRQNEDSGKSACGPSSEKHTGRQVGSRRRGEASVEMTAQDILSLAVNVVQNGWSPDECRVEADGCSIDLPNEVLHEVYEALLTSNRLAAAKRTGRARRVKR